MKLITIAIFTLLVSTSATCQNLSLDQIIEYAKCTSFTCFNKEIIKDNFTYNKSTEDENGVYYVFTSDKSFITDSNPNITMPNIANFILMKNGYRSVSFRTTQKYKYNELLTKLNDLKFYETTTIQTPTGILTVYQSKSDSKIEVMINVDNFNEKGIGEWISYNITIGIPK